MALTHDEVAEILQLVEQTRLRYFELEVDGTRIVCGEAAPAASATSAAGGPTGRDGPAPVASSAGGRSSPTDATAGTSTPREGADPSTSAPRTVATAPADVGESAVVVTAPMVGVFYRAPEPGAAPFAEVGQHVEAGATLGLVEVMKTFNSVTSDVSGVVVDVYAQDAAFVEFGAPLFAIEPSA